MGNLTEAARCAGTYLYLVPDSAEMAANVRFYQQEGGVAAEAFTPRQAAVEYVHRDNDEEALLTFIESEFVFSRGGEGKLQKEKDPSGDEFIAKVWTVQWTKTFRSCVCLSACNFIILFFYFSFQ